MPKTVTAAEPTSSRSSALSGRRPSSAATTARAPAMRTLAAGAVAFGPGALLILHLLPQRLGRLGADAPAFVAEQVDEALPRGGARAPGLAEDAHGVDQEVDVLLVLDVLDHKSDGVGVRL